MGSQAWELYEPGRYTDDDVIAVLYEWSKSKHFEDNTVVIQKYNPAKYWQQLVRMVEPGGLRGVMLRNPDKVTLLGAKPLRFKVHPQVLPTGLEGTAPRVPPASSGNWKDHEGLDVWTTAHLDAIEQREQIASTWSPKDKSWSWSTSPSDWSRVGPEPWCEGEDPGWSWAAERAAEASWQRHKDFEFHQRAGGASGAAASSGWDSKSPQSDEPISIRKTCRTWSHKDKQF